MGRRAREGDDRMIEPVGLIHGIEGALEIGKRIIEIQVAIDESDTPLGLPEMALKKMVAFTHLHEMAVEAGFSA